MVTLLLLFSNIPGCPLPDYGLCILKWPCVTGLGGITSVGKNKINFQLCVAALQFLPHILKMLAYNLFTPVFVLYMQSWSNLESQSEITI